ncbi:glycosyl transferase family 2 [Actinomycetospora succinea]|uniref:Glycosyl transferase family 2 n=1 Tax=Actinomycetospora succinea TaxID=663603 RepID=A0A4R6UNW9_9PSEU|nr:glycosyl transferase family 2 [Actinomycetospora succinea]
MIPTVNRPQLVVRAVQSALRQTSAPYEVLVVLDGTDEADVAEVRKLEDARVHILSTGGGSNDAGATARNLGIREAGGHWVALLDDDDEWLPNKLERQLAEAGAIGEHQAIVVSSMVERRSARTSTIWPTRPIRPDERVADYLFLRSSPGEGWLPTPTLMVPRAIAIDTPFDTSLRQHEDLDWMLRLEARGARFVVVPETLAVVHVAEGISLSNSARWPDSLAWACDRRTVLGERAFSAFCLTEVSRIARRRPSLRAFAKIARNGLSGKPRAIDVTQFLATWLVPDRVRRFLNGVRSAAVRRG